MSNVRFGESFEWNENKAELNPLKHNGITFEEATPKEAKQYIEITEGW